MYNFRLLKKFTAVILSGVILLSSTPANAWKSKNPLDGIWEDPVCENGYKISFDDTKRFWGSDVKIHDWSPWYIPEQVCWDCGRFKATIYGDIWARVTGNTIFYPVCDRYWTKFCDFLGYRKEQVTSIKMPLCLSKNQCAVFQRMVFPNLRLFTFCMYDNGQVAIIPETFSACPNLKFVFVGVSKDVSFTCRNCDAVNKEIDNIDLFPACNHSVTIVCETKEQADKFKKILGVNGRRHKVYTQEEFSKYDYITSPPKALSCSEFTEIDKNFVDSNVKEKSILIPKNINKIEKNAFKDNEVNAVVFEEGIEELYLCDECFAGCDLVKFKLPRSLKKIVLGKNCFKDCKEANSIEEYVKGEQRRIKEEEEEEKRRIEKEKEEERRRQEAEERDRKAKELEKWKEETQKEIDNKKSEISKEISSLEEKLKECYVVQQVRQQDLDSKTADVDTSSMSEIDLKLFNAEQGYFKAKLEVAKKDVELVKVELNGKKELFDNCNKQSEILKNAQEINLLFIDSVKESQEAQHNKREAERMFREAEEKSRELEKEYKRIAKEKDEIIEKEKRNAEIEREQQKEADRLRKEREEFEKEKNKSVFKKVHEYVSSLSPVEYLGGKISQVVLIAKIVLGAAGVFFVAKFLTPIINMFGAIKNLFKNSNHSTYTKEQ